MAVYQDKAKERIKGFMQKSKRITKKAKDDGYSEADTRKIVIDILTEALGWDRFDDITAEQMKSGGIADYVVKNNKEDLIVVEIKRVGVKLNQSHVDQAKAYAVEQGMEWAIVTNGDVWNVYRIIFNGKQQKMPEAIHVLTVSVLDESIKPPDRAALFYLFSKESFRRNELADYYERRIALSGENLASHILSEDVMNKLRMSLRNATGQKLCNSEIAEALILRLFKAEALTEDHDKAVVKMQRLERQKVQPKKDVSKESE